MPPRFFAVALILYFGSLTLLAPAMLPAQDASQKLQLNTSAFQPGANIPKQFTCDGGDVSPALSWNDPPAGTRSFVLIMDDPDAPAGTWVHWVIYNLPATARQLPAHVPRKDQINGGGWQGLNDFRMAGYGGPCPPPGNPHRYFFRLYALDNLVTVKPRARRNEIDRAMEGHVLAQAELMGTYGR